MQRWHHRQPPEAPPPQGFGPAQQQLLTGPQQMWPGYAPQFGAPPVQMPMEPMPMGQEGGYVSGSLLHVPAYHYQPLNSQLPLLPVPHSPMAEQLQMLQQQPAQQHGRASPGGHPSWPQLLPPAPHPIEHLQATPQQQGLQQLAGEAQTGLTHPLQHPPPPPPMHLQHQLQVPPPPPMPAGGMMRVQGAELATAAAIPAAADAATSLDFSRCVYSDTSEAELMPLRDGVEGEGGRLERVPAPELPPLQTAQGGQGGDVPSAAQPSGDG